jgi:Oxidoreductase family, NAD-binding Rossmann fold/Oxidoreductase family, C-terminal alpha/beta domain
MNRRHFLMGTAAAAMPRKARSSPNDTIRVAVVGVGDPDIGVRGQGRVHLQQFGAMPNVEVATVCDVDQKLLSYGQGLVEKLGKKKPAGVTDMRRILDDKSIDAITIATPDHLHALQAIWACQAGKDVYLEKPCAHNIWEVRQVVAAAHKYDRIVQHGVNARSGGAIREAVQKMREGLIGDVYMTRGIVFQWRPSIGRTPVEPVPAGVDYDLWLGPAPKRDFTRNRFHYNWHWLWEYGCGELGNQGAHEIARWGLGVKLPVKVDAIGDHILYDDDQETPNTMLVNWEFNEGGKKKLMSFEIRPWLSNNEAGIGQVPWVPGTKFRIVGNLFYGTKGYLTIEGYDRYKSFLGKESTPGPAKIEAGNLYANWIDALRTRDKTRLHGPIEEGALSVTLMHLANISYKLGRSLQIDPATGDVIGDSEASHLYKRQHYRAPFVVPEKV